MAYEKPKDAQEKEPLRIEDLPETADEQDAQVKGGMISRPGGGAFSDPDSGEEIDLLP